MERREREGEEMPEVEGAACEGEIEEQKGREVSAVGGSDGGECGNAMSVVGSATTHEVVDGFEGPEKILEVDFVVRNAATGASLRRVSRAQWDEILALARCEILSKLSNEWMDAYVLSESSLFVFGMKVFVKTCGTTTLLCCLPLLLERAKEVGLELQWIGYTRKNFTFPEDQRFPHNSFGQEIAYTNQCSGPRDEPLVGGAYILGDLLADHWYVFVADYCADENQSSERNINIMMYGLDEKVAKQFYRQPELTREEDEKRAAYEAAEIDSLCGPDALIDDRMFEPCGYSLNAIRGSTFYTLHVTPQSECSYASFETNLEETNYTALVEKVLKVYRPKRFIITVFADESALETIESCPTEVMAVSVHHTYKRETQSTTCIRVDYACRMSAYKQM